jgi:SAM-dependent methyltransferase
VSRSDVARRVAALYPTRFLRAYVRWKIASDPVYDAVYQRARGTILDLGCGAGVLAAYLRARGYDGEITGIDHDAWKIEVARGLSLRDTTFMTADVGQALACPDRLKPVPQLTVMLDLLHYLDDDAQSALLRSAAAGASSIIIREAIRDGTWRYGATYAQETFARGLRWLKAERLNFPRRETIVGAFNGFESEVAPLWGRTPFNNYLFVFKRPSSGMTKL